MTQDDFAATLPVAEVLEQLGVPYYIAGSVASSMHGRARSTLDVDIVARLESPHVTTFVRELEKQYYVDEAMIREAIRSRSSFNLIHYELQHKIDIFIDKGRPYDKAGWDRVRRGAPFEASEREFPLSSAEDVILAKLEWHRITPSDRQWDDVLGVIKLQKATLDVAYLQRWATELGVADLLERAWQEATRE